MEFGSYREGVERLTTLLLPVMAERFALLGEEGSGAYNFYKQRLLQRLVFKDYEIDLLAALAQADLPIRQIHDVGCGWGQLVFLLAWCGCPTVGYENDRKRFASAVYFQSVLGVLDPHHMRFASVSDAHWPPPGRARGLGQTLVVTTNIVTDEADLYEEGSIAGLARYPLAVVNVDRFCRYRGEADRHLLIERFVKAGLTHRGLFCDVGEDGQFHLFERG